MSMQAGIPTHMACIPVRRKTKKVLIYKMKRSELAATRIRERIGLLEILAFHLCI